MKNDDYILTFVAGLLTVQEANLSKAILTLAEQIVVDALETPQRVSVAARNLNGSLLTLTEWLNEIRSTVSGARIFQINPENELAPHNAAAFEGGIDKILQIQTTSGTKNFALAIRRSSQYAISPACFILLLQSQKKSSLFINKLLDEINRSNELNHGPKLIENDLLDYFETSEGKNHFDMMGGRLFSELQVEGLTFDQELIIPETMKTFVRPNEGDGFASSENHVFLYPVQEVTGKQILQLIEAQGFGDTFWKHCEDMSKNPSEFGPALPVVAAKDWPEFLQKLSFSEANDISHALLRQVCLICEEKNISPQIPDQLKSLFGPDEVDRRRIKYRGALQHSTGWSLTPNESPWQMYVFQEVHFEKPLALNSPSANDIAENKTHFEKVLVDLEKFASRNESPWSEAFKIALFFSEKAHPGLLTELEVQKIPEMLKTKGFSENAVSVYQRSAAVMGQFICLGWDKAKIFGLMSVSLADVFGGMGSWNDQMFDGEAAEAYEKLTSDLFAALQARFADLLA